MKNFVAGCVVGMLTWMIVLKMTALASHDPRILQLRKRDSVVFNFEQKSGEFYRYVADTPGDSPDLMCTTTKLVHTRVYRTQRDGTIMDELHQYDALLDERGQQFGLATTRR